MTDIIACFVFRIYARYNFYILHPFFTFNYKLMYEVYTVI